MTKKKRQEQVVDSLTLRDHQSVYHIPLLAASDTILNEVFHEYSSSGMDMKNSNSFLLANNSLQVSSHHHHQRSMGMDIIVDASNQYHSPSSSLYASDEYCSSSVSNSSSNNLPFSTSFSSSLSSSSFASSHMSANESDILSTINNNDPNGSCGIEQGFHHHQQQQYDSLPMLHHINAQPDILEFTDNSMQQASSISSKSKRVLSKKAHNMTTTTTCSNITAAKSNKQRKTQQQQQISARTSASAATTQKLNEFLKISKKKSATTTTTSNDNTPSNFINNSVNNATTNNNHNHNKNNAILINSTNNCSNFHQFNNASTSIQASPDSQLTMINNNNKNRADSVSNSIYLCSIKSENGCSLADTVVASTNIPEQTTTVYGDEEFSDTEDIDDANGAVSDEEDEEFDDSNTTSHHHHHHEEQYFTASSSHQQDYKIGHQSSNFYVINYISDDEEFTTSCVLLENLSGSARTDYKFNRQYIDKYVQKRKKRAAGGGHTSSFNIKKAKPTDTSDEMNQHDQYQMVNRQQQYQFDCKSTSPASSILSIQSTSSPDSIYSFCPSVSPPTSTNMACYVFTPSVSSPTYNCQPPPPRMKQYHHVMTQQAIAPQPSVNKKKKLTKILAKQETTTATSQQESRSMSECINNFYETNDTIFIGQSY